MNATQVKVGDVVHFSGKRRRYVIVSIDQWGKLTLVAMSGGMPGCYPTSVDPEMVDFDDNQQRGAIGPRAAYLQRRYAQAQAMARDFGHGYDTTTEL